MSTRSSSADLTPEAALRQLEGGVTAVLSDADASQTLALKGFGLVQAARLSRLNRTAAQAIADSGADSAEATAAKAAVAAGQATASRVTLLHQQAATKAPTVVAAGWALHGRVYSSDLAPLERYTVFLVDGQKNYLAQYGFDYTNSSGYFLLNHDPTAATAPAGANDGANETGAAPQLFLQIANPKARAVHSSAGAFTPQLGAATYQSITLPAGEPTLGDPPAEIRAVALPRGGKGRTGSKAK